MVGERKDLMVIPSLYFQSRALNSILVTFSSGICLHWFFTDQLEEFFYCFPVIVSTNPILKWCLSLLITLKAGSEITNESYDGSPFNSLAAWHMSKSWARTSDCSNPHTAESNARTFAGQDVQSWRSLQRLFNVVILDSAAFWFHVACKQGIGEIV